MIVDVGLRPVHDGRRHRPIALQVDEQLQGGGHLRRRDVPLVATVRPHERHELPRALIGRRRRERETVRASRGQLLCICPQLGPRLRRRNACLGEDVLVVEQRDRVRDRLQAVELAFICRGSDDTLQVALRRDRVIAERCERAGLRELLEIRVVEHQHIRKRVGRRHLQHLLDQVRAGNSIAVDLDADSLATGVENAADDRLVGLVGVIIDYANGRRARGRWSGGRGRGTVGGSSDEHRQHSDRSQPRAAGEGREPGHGEFSSRGMGDAVSTAATR